MSFSEKNVEMLIDFGLTRNQAKVYVAIARLRLASVGQIYTAEARKNGISRKIIGETNQNQSHTRGRSSFHPDQT
jgi:hypothetical protein